MKLMVLLVFAGIVVSLGLALSGLFRRGGRDPRRMVNALTLRVALSVALLTLLLLAWALGFIEPHGLVP